MIKNLSNFDDLPLMISVTDLADILNISRMGAYNLCHRKDFPSIRIGNRLLIPKEKLTAWIDAQPKGWE